jgi:nicotinate-nucleotide--dimethylbenzimidazole phosphoribosyltransferase
MQPLLEPQSVGAFGDAARRAVYDAILLRRDVRHFVADAELEDGVLERILGAAHLAPSVGFSQPWGFVVVRDRVLRGRIRESFLRCREAEAVRYPPARREAYLAHRLEGILESSLNVCVVVDLRAQGDAILGTTAQPEAVRASACCAVQNLWLAARVEGIGVGWVSIVEPAVLRAELTLPPGVEPIAYLCVGHPVAFRERPMLEETGWRSRRPLADVVHTEGRFRDVPVPPRQTSAARPDVAKSRPISPPNAGTRALMEAHQATRTKPIGSLGRLEELARFHAAARGVFPPRSIRKPVLALFAADHGVVVEGVSAYGSQMTAAMVANVMAGGAAVNALTASAGVEVLLMDVGVAGDLSAAPTHPVVPLSSRAVRRGTGNLRREPAMSLVEARAALEAGEAAARELCEAGADVILLGELGIGNTTAAAALTAFFTDAAASDVVGRGTGISEDVLVRKRAVVEDALALHRPFIASPIDALSRLGGLELAAMAGAALEAARRRVPVILDGFVTNAAALVAQALDPNVTSYLLAGHGSPEPGAKLALAKLGLVPLLDLEMRLGEGTGAVLAAGILRAAVAASLSMASFATAGIVGRPGTELPEMQP